MPEKLYLLNQFQGMNRDGSKYNMSPVWLWDLYNGYLDRSEDGRDAIKSRWGLTKVNTTAVTGTSGDTSIRAMFEARFSGSSDTFIIFETRSKVYRMTTAGVWTALYDPTDADDRPGQFCMYNDLLIIVSNGTVKQCNSSWTVAALSSDGAEPTSIVACHTHNYRLVLADSSFVVYLSRVNDATSATAWSAESDFASIDLKKVVPSGDVVIAMKTLGDSLLAIICSRHIIIYDVPTVTTDLSLQQIIPLGAVSGTAFGAIGNDLIYPSTNGLRTLISSITNQKLDTNTLSKGLGDYYRELIENASETNFIKSISGCFHPRLNHYYISFRSATSGYDQTLVFSIRHGGFTGRWIFHQVPSAWLEASDGTVYVGTEDLDIFKLDSSVNLDDSTAISGHFEMPMLGNDTPFQYKSFEEVMAQVELNQSTDFTFTYAYGFENVISAISNSVTLASSGILRDLSPRDRDTLINLKLAWATSGSNVKIYHTLIKTITEEHV